MTSTFFRHELKAFWRSKNTGKSIAVRIVMGLLILYFLVIISVIGFSLNKFLEKAAGSEKVITYCGIILLYYLTDLFTRLQLQDLPTLRVQPYLQLPVKRNSLVRYLAFTALFSVFNLWPFLLFVPFIFKAIAPASGGMVALSFVASIVGLTVFNNYLALYLKRLVFFFGWVFFVVVVLFFL